MHMMMIDEDEKKKGNARQRVEFWLTGSNFLQL